MSTHYGGNEALSRLIDEARDRVQSLAARLRGEEASEETRRLVADLADLLDGIGDMAR
ncbi:MULTISPECIES: hypothetical protein [Nguyenibacter]|uniref:Uncharacterized protein n=1 Tax=Nguyenibacter vanlangensis TaxID=1216886 RepID=A0ABZ3DAJ6_9PROT|nr:hypothetical protein [Nguyenibacter sp. L1]WRH89411.1 hypothetical protein QN315_07425 [Nguyenibacter sp. L1]